MLKWNPNNTVASWVSCLITHSNVAEKVANKKWPNSYEELRDVVIVLQRLQCIFRGQLPIIHRDYCLYDNWSSSLWQKSRHKGIDISHFFFYCNMDPCGLMQINWLIDWLIDWLSFRLNWKWSELHFSESQRVAVAALPVIPRHTITVRRCLVAPVS